MKPLILIANDDGYHAKGLNQLIQMLKGTGDIIVCAPESARSGYSRAFSTTTLTLKHRRHEDYEGTSIDVWSCSGTPVDCVKMAYAKICPRKADILIGGINHGDNASTNAHYSGTVGIVVEGALKGIPSVAFSLCDYDDDADFEPMRPLVTQVVKRFLPRDCRTMCASTSTSRGSGTARCATAGWLSGTGVTRWMNANIRQRASRTTG